MGDGTENLKEVNSSALQCYLDILSEICFRKIKYSKILRELIFKNHREPMCRHDSFDTYI